MGCRSERPSNLDPPEEIAKAFQELFADKIAKTKIACAKAREEMAWPSRKDA